jgi:ABC-type taurine transport system substrate-binding protein
MDHISAMDKGYFREEGLNIEVIRAPGGVATPGLLSGQFQFSSSASSAVSAAVRGGPVKIVYTNLSRPSYTLVSIKPDITSAKELVGKKIAVNSFGDTGHLATILYLKKMGVSRACFNLVGRNESFSALRTGAIDAAPGAPRYGGSKDQKHVVLADLGKDSTGVEWRCRIQQAFGETRNVSDSCAWQRARVRPALQDERFRSYHSRSVSHGGHR